MKEISKGSYKIETPPGIVGVIHVRLKEKEETVTTVLSVDQPIIKQSVVNCSNEIMPVSVRETRESHTQGIRSDKKNHNKCPNFTTKTAIMI